jgi:hypothetical protein
VIAFNLASRKATMPVDLQRAILEALESTFWLAQQPIFFVIVNDDQLMLMFKKKKGLGFLGLGRRVEANSNKMFAEEEIVRA